MFKIKYDKLSVRSVSAIRYVFKRTESSECLKINMGNGL